MNTWMKQNALCFDIGANVGQSAEQFLTAGAGQVVSVEPAFENFTILQRQKGVVPIMAAAWKTPGLVGVRYAWNQSGWSSIQPDKWKEAYPDARFGDTQVVPAITLDQLWEKFGEPFLIKIDVEGSELEVLQGLTQRPEFLIFEFHGKFVTDAMHCLEYCEKLGFTKAHYVRENLDLETVPTMPLEEFTPRWRADAPEWGNITVT